MTKVNPGKWALLQGFCAKHTGGKRKDCPYPRRSALALIWRGAWHIGKRRGGAALRDFENRPWTPVEEEALRIAAGATGAGGGILDSDLALVLRRTPQAIRLKRMRLGSDVDSRSA